ncbi:alpha glucosidase [Dichotomocladium elegans]|nr:alpha glucosidase [Dichotomocladium elegans]
MKTPILLAILAITGVFAEVNYDVSFSAPGYKISGHVGHTATGLEIPLSFNGRKNKGRDLYGKTIDELVVSVDYEAEDRLRVSIADKANKQIPVPDSGLGLRRSHVTSAAKHTNYDFRYTNRPFGFQVIRKSDKEILFDTTDFPLVYEDQYLELSTAVPDDTNLYGIGETTAPFRRFNEHNSTTIWARDIATPFYENIYGAHPYYTEIREGKSHGALLLNAHGMDVIFSKGRITYKVIGGILEYYFFVPKDGRPNSVTRAYTDFVGKPFMPALWMLGWHHCRYGFKDIEHVNEVVTRYKESNIPLETIWVDIDYMDRRKDFTFDPIKFPEESMKALSDRMHANNQRMITMVDPALSTNDTYEPYQRGKEMDVFLKNNDGSDFVGQVWPGYTVFPDWWHPNATEFWEKEIIDWMHRLNLDGLWVDMNEPASFCIGSCGSGKQNTVPVLYWTLPPEEQEKVIAKWHEELDATGNSVPGDSRNLLHPNYAINNGAGNLSDRTASTTTLHYGNIPHYDLHNLYGNAELELTKNALLKDRPNERPFILSRSMFVGSGSKVGHWTGDNHSTWAKLKSSISEILNMQMFGISYAGADVCGFNDNTTEQLCSRWSELGAFYPFARNHNNDASSDQEPYLWKSTTEASIKALGIRYALLPYYYTLFEESSTVGTGVWRPLIFEYPEIDAYAANDEQVLVGSDILLSPVVYENATTVDAQIPPGIWYDYYTNKPLEGPAEVTLDAPLTHIPVHVRGGAIVPRKTNKYLVSETYATPYNLLVALDNRSEAKGRLYIDDLHSVEQPKTSNIHFEYRHGLLKATGTFNYDEAEHLGSITILGAKKLSTAIYNGKKFPVKNKHGGVAVVEGLDIPLDGKFKIKFH